ncbi:uncharacterized protein LOC136055662 [Cyrtonyx montezumae]|uniref:uncharacterized protein LOC136055662 n=1 Tax=Cyrtonyx montezumae TaxID=9017 RepID=UPI0032DAFFC4
MRTRIPAHPAAPLGGLCPTLPRASPRPPAQRSAWVTGSGVAGAGEREVKVKSSSGLGLAAAARWAVRLCPEGGVPARCCLTGEPALGAALRSRDPTATARPAPLCVAPLPPRLEEPGGGGAELPPVLVFMRGFRAPLTPESVVSSPLLPSPSLPSVSWNFLRRFSSSPALSPGFSSFINALSLLRWHRRRRNNHPLGAGLRPLSEPPEKLRAARGRAPRRLRAGATIPPAGGTGGVSRTDGGGPPPVGVRSASWAVGTGSGRGAAQRGVLGFSLVLSITGGKHRINWILVAEAGNSVLNGVICHSAQVSARMSGRCRSDLSSCLPGGLNCKSVSSDAPYTVGRCVTSKPERDGSSSEELSDTSVGWVVRKCRNPHEIADLTCEEHTAPLSDSGSANTQTRGTEPGAC